MPLPLIPGAIALAGKAFGAAKAAAPWLVPSVLAAGGAQRTNQMARDNMREQMDWQERMANTSKQRAVADLKAAGLNPGLAYGYSAPMGSVAAAPVADEIGAGVSSAQQARQLNVNLVRQAADARIANAEAKIAEQKAREFTSPVMIKERIEAAIGLARRDGLAGVEAFRQRDEALKTQEQRLAAFGLSNDQIRQVINSGRATEEETRQRIGFLRTMQPMETEMMRLRQAMQALEIVGRRYRLGQDKAESQYFNAVGGVGVGAERLGSSVLFRNLGFELTRPRRRF